MLTNRSNPQTLYKFAADSSYHGAENDHQGIVFHAFHELLKMNTLNREYDSAHFSTGLGKGRKQVAVNFADLVADKYGLKLRYYPVLQAPIPANSQFGSMYLPFDSVSKEWTFQVSEVAVSLIFQIGKMFRENKLFIDNDNFIDKETSADGLEDMLNEAIKTTAEIFTWAGLGHDVEFNIGLLEQAINTVDNPNASNPVSVYSSIANTGFGLLVPMVSCGYLAPDVFMYGEDGTVTLNPAFRGLLNDWKTKTARGGGRYTGGCLWRFREYTKPDGTKYSLEYSMIDMAALVMLKFLKQGPEIFDEA